METNIPTPTPPTPMIPPQDGLAPLRSDRKLEAAKSNDVRIRPKRSMILIVDDDEAQCELIASRLSSPDVDVEWCTSALRALELVEIRDIDLILTDVSMAGMDGIELCNRLRVRCPDVPVVVMTGYGTLDAAIGAMRAGAYDFLTKPLDNDLLSVSVSRALQHRALRAEVKRLRRATTQGTFGDLIGESPALRRALDLVARVADSDASVLITGESGTGKELIARAIHQRSARTDGPFLAINCAAVPAGLIESELFGHAKGAFTDAKQAKDGLFVAAHGGTLFLDEVAELPLELQPKLLRALQTRVVRPVGSTTEIPFDARIVTATNRDLEEEVQQRRFREDLYYRINVVSVAVPPLRERGSDVLLLAQRFLERAVERTQSPVTGFAPEVAERLLAYDWPGNVRELENCIERAVVLARAEVVTLDDLPERIRRHEANRVVLTAEDPSELISIEELERRYVAKVLNLVGGNKSRAAQILGLDRRTLYRKLERWGKRAS